MALTSKIENGEAVAEKPFPKIMRGTSTGSLVLFNKYECGTVIVCGSDSRNYTLGHRSNGWDMSYFEDIDYPQTITFNYE